MNNHKKSWVVRVSFWLGVECRCLVRDFDSSNMSQGFHLMEWDVR